MRLSSLCYRLDEETVQCLQDYTGGEGGREEGRGGRGERRERKDKQVNVWKLGTNRMLVITKLFWGAYCNVIIMNNNNIVKEK